jgi:predicted DNA-binding transcriptional regulator YafY
VKSDVSPTGRALRVLGLLQAQPGITSDQIAEQLGVTSRAARRYISILREADIPVESSRGPYGGYQLGRGLRLPPLIFSAAEALGLVMAVLDGRHAAADTENPVGAALGKIIRALPESVGRQAATMRQHATAVPARSATRPDPETTSVLAEAVADRRRVRIGYRSQSGKEWEEEAEPWAVVVRYGLWYLLCHSLRADAVRTYRIDRIQSVTRSDQEFRAPESLDPAALLEEHLGVGWEFATHVVFKAAYDDVARHVTPPMGRLEPLDAGRRCALIGATGNPAMYAAEWLAAIPFPFHVEGGPELRAAVAAVAARLTNALGVSSCNS